MAAFGSDTILKPLQNAMKMAKTAIQMDAENQHKVVRRLVLLLVESYFKSYQTLSMTLCKQKGYLHSVTQVPTTTIFPLPKTLYVLSNLIVAR